MGRGHERGPGTRREERLPSGSPRKGSSMRRMVAMIGVTLLSTLGSVASADEPASGSRAWPAGPMIQLGLRFGYAIPLGNLAKDAKTGTVGLPLRDTFVGGIPIVFDLGFRVAHNFYLGGYGQYGVMFVNDDKNPGCKQASCSGSDVRIGANLHYHISPQSPVEPWLGAGIGYEWMTLSASSDGNTVSATFEGVEILNLQAWCDFRGVPGFDIGPFVSFSLGRFSSGSVGGSTGGVSADIPNRSSHEWLTIGLRGVFSL
jgi:hypothetical protein